MSAEQLRVDQLELGDVYAVQGTLWRLVDFKPARGKRPVSLILIAEPYTPQPCQVEGYCEEQTFACAQKLLRVFRAPLHEQQPQTLSPAELSHRLTNAARARSPRGKP